VLWRCWYSLLFELVKRLYEHYINHNQTLFSLTFRSLSETFVRSCSILLPVLATVVMWRGKKSVVRVARSRFMLIVNPDLDSLANRMVWIRGRGLVSVCLRWCYWSFCKFFINYGDVTLWYTVDWEMAARRVRLLSTSILWKSTNTANRYHVYCILHCHRC